MSVLLDNLDAYARGMRVTISLTVLSFAIAFVLGVLLASFRVSPVPPLRVVGLRLRVRDPQHAAAGALLLRASSGSRRSASRCSPFTCAVVVLSAYTAAFMAETIRSGFNAVAAGQAEAARAIGLTFPQVLLIVVLPQALRTVVAAARHAVHRTDEELVDRLHDLGRGDHRARPTQLGSDLAEYPAALLGAAVAYLLPHAAVGLVVGVIERRVRGQAMSDPVFGDVLGPRGRRRVALASAAERRRGAGARVAGRASARDKGQSSTPTSGSYFVNANVAKFLATRCAGHDQGGRRRHGPQRGARWLLALGRLSRPFPSRLAGRARTSSCSGPCRSSC